MNEFHFDLPIDAALLATLRHTLSAWLENSELEGLSRDDLVLATHEAAANAIEHAGASDPVWVDAFVLDGEIIIEVHDTGHWKDDQQVSELRGRGLSLVSMLVNDVEVLRDSGGTTLRLLQPEI